MLSGESCCSESCSFGSEWKAVVRHRVVGRAFASLSWVVISHAVVSY